MSFSLRANQLMSLRVSESVHGPGFGCVGISSGSHGGTFNVTTHSAKALNAITPRQRSWCRNTAVTFAWQGSTCQKVLPSFLTCLRRRESRQGAGDATD